LIVGLVLDRSLCACHGGWRERGSEDETRGQGADRVYELRRTSDVTTNATVGLTKCSSDDVYSFHDSTLGTAGFVRFIVWSVHADSMDFIQKGQRAVLVGEVTDFFDGPNRAAHAVHAFECDDLGVLCRD
jgi:hypothetical protein